MAVQNAVLAIEVLQAAGADTATGADLRSSPDTRGHLLVTQILMGGGFPDEGCRLQALLRATKPLVLRSPSPG